MVASDLGEGEMGSEHLISTGFFGGWWKCSKIDYGDGCKPLWVYTRNHWTIFFEWIGWYIDSYIKKLVLEVMFN